MKYLYLYIVIIFSFFKGVALAAEYGELPADFEGKITKELWQDEQNDEISDNSVVKNISVMLEIGDYLDKKFPEEKIYDKSFKRQLRVFFPQDDEATFKQHTTFVRNSLTIYRKIKDYIKQKVDDKLVPKSYREVRSDDDFDHPDDVPYIEARPGHFLKAYNFKKFLTYSKNPEETAAITRYQNQLSKKNNVMQQLDYALSKIEWKKMPFYGTKFRNPLLTTLGVGDMIHNKYVSARLISEQTYIKNNDELTFGLQLITEGSRFILANDLSPYLQKPQIDFTKSTNVASCKILYPVPLNNTAIPYAHKYFGDFMILLKVKPEDKQKPLTLHLETQLQACGSDMFCNPEYFINELTIAPDGNDILFNGYDNFFFRNASLLPHKDGKNLHLQSAVIDEYQNTQSLRLKFTTTAKVKNFKVFVEEKDGYTKFSAPGISINDNQINVQFQPLEEGRTPNLINSEFTVTAVLNTHDALRTTIIATKASLFDAQAVHLNFALLLLAILGGLILNFMPCVFPVLSLKIMAISQAVGNGKTNIKHSLRHTIYGIFSGFTLITAILLLAKYAGYSLGWGMQFQNMSFLVIMLFVLAAFIAVLPHVNFADIYHYTASSDKLNFTAGTLIVLLSTPCTAPYLATAVGFALTGGYTDIICILYAIALGVSLPYILLLWLKNPADLFPKPGAWLKKLDIFMQIMLYLTIIWLLTLVYNQTDGITIAKIVFSIFTFALCFRLYMMFLNYLQGIFDEEITLQVLAKARRIATALIFGLFAGLCFWCSHTATYKQQIRLTNVQSSLAAVDTDLIAEKLKQGKSVLLEISADWCMTCHVNNILALKPSRLRLWKKLYNLELIKTDWTNYNRKTLDFMEKYGRKGLPFYVLYTPLLRDGIVLPEMFSSQDLENLLANSYKL